MQVEVWSDVVCPFCWIGKRRLSTAVHRFRERHPEAEVAVRLRSFELDPSIPRDQRGSVLDYLGRKYGGGRRGAVAMTQRVIEYGAGDGLTFDFERAVRVNTFDAHRLLHAAATEGVGDALAERLFRAHFTEGADLADQATLVALAVEAGLAESRVRQVLESQEFGDAVRADEAEARDIGANGVPFFVIDQKYGVSGAQPVEVFVQVLGKAYAESRKPIVMTGDSAAACEDDSCAVPTG